MAASVRPHDDHGVALLAADEGVHVFHGDPREGQDLQYLGQTAGTVVHDGGDDGALLDDKVMGPQDLGGLVGVVDDQAQDAEVGGVGQGEGAHVHAVVGQDLGDLAQLAGLVLDENRDLGDEQTILLLLFRCG